MFFINNIYFYIQGIFPEGVASTKSTRTHPKYSDPIQGRTRGMRDLLLFLYDTDIKSSMPLSSEECLHKTCKGHERTIGQGSSKMVVNGGPDVNGWITHIFFHFFNLAHISQPAGWSYPSHQAPLSYHYVIQVTVILFLSCHSLIVLNRVFCRVNLSCSIFINIP